MFLFRGIGCIVVLFIGAIIGAICWPYTINTWLIYLNKEPTVVWWQGAILGFVPGIGQFSILLAVITWILMLFLR